MKEGVDIDRLAGDERAIVEVPPIVGVEPIRVSLAVAVVAPKFRAIQVAVGVEPRRTFTQQTIRITAA